MVARVDIIPTRERPMNDPINIQAGEVVYQIQNWNHFFENNKSRERESCRFVCIPNKRDGTGLALVLAHPNGASIYGIFHLLVCHASAQRIRDRDGWLTL